ncbi:MAG TPA: alpha/beta fold hydrolase [Bordetella sp.]
MPAQSASGPGAPRAGRLHQPVKRVADQRIRVEAPEGAGELPVYANRPIDAPAPGIRQAFIIVHGTLRNADDYYAIGLKVLAQAGEDGRHSLLVAPQFLTEPDVRAHSLPGQVLAWSQNGWKDGAAARRPAPISSFSAFDALLAHFADRRLYPDLSSVIVVGHSAGAQAVQRYAVAGQGEAALTRAGIAVRYVVANPSSYAYFDEQRPAPAGGFAPADAGACPSAVQWKYGMAMAPPYVSAQDGGTIEARYAARKVTYLLGMNDTDPRRHFIDRSCAAMAQGPYRLARGLAYFDYVRRRHPSGLRQSLVEVPGVGHDGAGMLTSACGMAVLFGRKPPASCPATLETGLE